MFVIAGASGNTGKVAAKRLLAAGKRVRALVRDAGKARELAALGAEVVSVDLADRPGLERALSGAAGFYLLSPPDPAATSFLRQRSALFDSVASAVKAAAVPHVVFLSSIGAHQPSGTGIIQSVRAGEQALRAVGVTSTFLRPAYFVENWGAVLPAARQDGVLPSFIPADLVMPMVSTVDIGALAAEALLEGPRGTRAIELSGPGDASPREVAATLAKILERPVQLIEAPLEAVVPTFTSFGMSSDIAGLFREMYQGIRDGSVAAEVGNETRRGSTSLEVTLRALAG